MRTHKGSSMQECLKIEHLEVGSTITHSSIKPIKMLDHLVEISLTCNNSKRQNQLMVMSMRKQAALTNSQRSSELNLK